jgi:Methyltransferase domain
MLASPERRAIRAMLRRHARQVLQPHPMTAEDRYPEVFTAISAHLWEVENPLILSYGCSDGSEVRSLRRWFPQAKIVGLDPNALMITQAKAHLALNPDPGIRYVEATSPEALGDMQFDAIFAMAVFRHGDLERLQPASSAQTLPFARFAEAVALLDMRLKPGGWLSIWNAHFRFADTETARGYKPRSLVSTRDDPQTLVYDANDRRVTDAAYADVIFRKNA